MKRIYLAIPLLCATAAAQIEPNAGTWKTWVISSGSQFRLPAPPTAAEQRGELEFLRQFSSLRSDPQVQHQVIYWNTGSPGYRWSQIYQERATARNLGGAPLLRGGALMHAAIYDATIAAWDSKYAHNRRRPSQADSTLTTMLPVPDHPSYPSEHAVVAGAVAAVLAYVIPADTQLFNDLAQEAARSRLFAGLHYPSDMLAGLDLGRRVGEAVVARGRGDGSDRTGTPQIPTGPCFWNGTNPASPFGGTWKTWALASGSEFRPPPPPDCNSAAWRADLNELRTFTPTDATNRVAHFWNVPSSYPLYQDVINRLILENRLADNPPRAARAAALATFAHADSWIACFDAKYTYWSIRPNQVAPPVTPIYATPNHPSYPSAAACFAGTVNEVLGSLFPVERDALEIGATEAGLSRIYGGIHYRHDVDGGVTLGRRVARKMMEWAAQDGSAP